MRRIGADYTLQGELVVLLKADNTLPGGGGIPFVTISLRCRNLSPKLNPWVHSEIRTTLTLPKRRTPETSYPTSRQPPLRR